MIYFFLAILIGYLAGVILGLSIDFGLWDDFDLDVIREANRAVRSSEIKQKMLEDGVSWDKIPTEIIDECPCD